MVLSAPGLEPFNPFSLPQRPLVDADCSPDRWRRRIAGRIGAGVLVLAAAAYALAAQARPVAAAGISGGHAAGPAIAGGD